MATNSAFVRVARTGQFYVADGIVQTPITSVTQAIPAGYRDVGYLTSSASSFTRSVDVTAIYAWQGSDKLTDILNSSEVTLTAAFAEAGNPVVQEFVNATKATADGAITIDPGAAQPLRSVLINIVDGLNVVRLWAPATRITSWEDTSLSNDDIISAGVTLTTQKTTIAGTVYGPLVLIDPALAPAA